ncbi:MAG: zinc ribbon domain-containing protein [Gammaproteobacteria bacterium]|nr:MAG: zinc ribbon domain-containing protein [Gammaproteobacteria bacterium]
MPIYEYRCQSCGHELEALQKVSEEPLRECPSCGKPTLRRLVSAAGFRLSGSGWYETDFKDKKSQRHVKREEGKSPGESGGGEGKAGGSDKAAPKKASAA